MSFAKFFLERELDFGEVLNESVEMASLSKRKIESMSTKLKNKYTSHFYEKFPSVQYEDLEDAFKDAVADAIKEKPKSESSAKSKIKKNMEKNLLVLKGKKKKIGKSISCVKSMKLGSDHSELIKRAERTLTNKEKKVLHMCSQGKSVRVIGNEMGLSFPTAWRLLNMAIDKVRISHGFKSRKLG